MYICDMMRSKLLFLSAVLFAVSANAQTEKKPLTITGYGEIYYGYDFDQPGNNSRPSFIYSHNRHNEVNVNLAMLHAGYEKGRIRANIGLMTGTYANANLAAEPGVMKNVYEANVGIRLHKTRELWLDAGVMPSHIGPEGAISMDCAALTRSLFAEGSPYYESGVRLSYKNVSEKWYLALYYLNGWQTIYRVNGNSTPAGGTQVTFTPNNKFTVNWSTFVGSVYPNPIDTRMRYFSDLYAIYKPTKKLEFTLLYDVGSEDGPVDNTQRGWFTTALIARYQANKSTHLVARAEYFHDEWGIIVPVSPANDFNTQGYSLGFDRSIMKNVLWRTEAKLYICKDDIFTGSVLPNNMNGVITTSLAVRFQK